MLETCVKNCGHRFHVLLAKKELMDELVKILNPKVMFDMGVMIH